MVIVSLPVEASGWTSADCRPASTDDDLVRALTLGVCGVSAGAERSRLLELPGADTVTIRVDAGSLRLRTDRATDDSR